MLAQLLTDCSTISSQVRVEVRWRVANASDTAIEVHTLSDVWVPEEDRLAFNDRDKIAGLYTSSLLVPMVPYMNDGGGAHPSIDTSGSQSHQGYDIMIERQVGPSEQ